MGAAAMTLPGHGLLQRPLKVACIQMASGPDKMENLAKARTRVLQAASEGASLIILPECDEAGRIYNTAAVYSPRGALLAAHRKLHLFDVDIPGGMSFHESDCLSAGNTVTTVALDGYGIIGLGICYDLRFAEPSIIAARRDAFALVYPSAFNTTTGPLHWELLGRARAVDNQVYTVLCSQARDPAASYPAWGHSMVTDPMGRVVATTEEGDAIVYARLDPQAIAQSRAAIPITRQWRHDVYPDLGRGMDERGAAQQARVGSDAVV